jgi:hypothetical protein
MGPRECPVVLHGCRPPDKNYGGNMYRIQNLGIPNNRTHQVPTDQVLQGGKKISANRTDGNGYKHRGVTLIEPNRATVHVTDKLGASLEKFPEIVVLEKVADKKG